MNRKQLWNSILQQAISGKLVPQLDNEPAIEQIGPAPDPDKVEFELPPKWKWITLGTLVDLVNGDRGPNYPAKSKLTSTNTGLPFVSAGDLEGNEISSKSLLYLSPEQCQLLRSGHIKAGDFLLCIRGSLGKFAIAKANGGAIASSLVILRSKSSDLLDARYLSCFLQSSLFKDEIKGTKNGTCQPNLGAKILANFLVPLPPLEEQCRIVARLEEVNLLVDKFGEAQEQLIKLEAKFPSKLKASVLQQAIKGLLVPQLDSEPEVEQLGPAPKPDEVPFVLPPKWKWVQLETICSYLQRGKSPKYSEIKQLPVIAQKCNQWDGLHMERALFIDPATIESYKPERFLQQNDILLNSTGTGTLGRVGLYDSSVNPYEQAVADGHVTVIRINNTIAHPYFIKHALASTKFQTIIIDAATGTTKQKELNLSTVKQLLVPLPPIEEQRRIVAKLEEVFEGVKQLGSLMEYA